VEILAGVITLALLIAVIALLVALWAAYESRGPH
jgi:hypothetical protein